MRRTVKWPDVFLEAKKKINHVINNRQLFTCPPRRRWPARWRRRRRSRPGTSRSTGARPPSPWRPGGGRCSCCRCCSCRRLWCCCRCCYSGLPPAKVACQLNGSFASGKKAFPSHRQKLSTVFEKHQRKQQLKFVAKSGAHARFKLLLYWVRFFIHFRFLPLWQLQKLGIKLVRT